MDFQFIWLMLFNLVTISLSANIQILYSPDSIIFQNTTNFLSSSDLSKFLNQCLGYTTKKFNWDGIRGYKNIAKNIPHSVILFHMPFSLKTIAVQTFPFQIESNLKEQYLQTKDIIISRNVNNEKVITDFIQFFHKNDKSLNTIDAQLDSLNNYLTKMQQRNENQPTFLWFEIFSEQKKLNNENLENIEERFQKIINHLKYLFGNNLLIFSIYDENQMFFNRATRQSENTRDTSKTRKANLAHEYDVDFHSSFVSIGFATLLFVLAVFIISVSMWNIDPGRDSIIYRLTSQKIKKDQ